MRKIYILLTIVFLILLSFPALSIENIYLGSFSPEKELAIEFTVNFKNDDSFENKIIIEFKDAEFISQNSIIPNSRITSNFRTGIISFQKDQTIISMNQLKKETDYYILPLNLKLFPQDKPGLFENTILIKNTNGDLLYEKNIIFEVNPWTIFELSKEKYLRIMNSNNNQKLKSNGEVIIKVASNSSWELYGLLNDEAKEFADKISLFIKQDDNYRTVKKGPFQIHSKSQLITQGTKTVSEENYWEEIEILMEIDEIKNIKSGLKIFPVIFYLYSIN